MIFHRLSQHLGLQIEHAITQTIVRPGSTIMNFIGMQYNDLAGQAEITGATVVEFLNTIQRQAKGIGVMTVRFEKIA